MNKRTLVIFLLVSLMGNLVLLGFILGQTFAQRTVDWSYSFTRTMQVLAPERRDELLRSVEPSRKKLKPALVELRQYQHQVRDAILADPFDADDYLRASELYNAKVIDARNASNAVFLSLLKSMTAQERQQMVSAAHRGRTKSESQNELRGDDGSPSTER